MLISNCLSGPAYLSLKYFLNVHPLLHPFCLLLCADLAGIMQWLPDWPLSFQSDSVLINSAFPRPCPTQYLQHLRHHAG